MKIPVRFFKWYLIFIKRSIVGLIIVTIHRRTRMMKIYHIDLNYRILIWINLSKMFRSCFYSQQIITGRKIILTQILQTFTQLRYSRLSSIRKPSSKANHLALVVVPLRITTFLTCEIHPYIQLFIKELLEKLWIWYCICIIKKKNLGIKNVLLMKNFNYKSF